MPIKGLSEQRRLPRLGKIRLGVKKVSEKSGKEYPAACEYFVLPEELKQYITEEHPDSLAIMFPTEDEEIISQQYYKRYSGERGLTCKGDGLTCRRMVDKQTGDFAHHDTREVVWSLNVPCQGRDCCEYLAKPQACKEVLNLQFIMPDIPGLGTWQIDTSSINSIRNINSAIAMIRAVYGRIAFIPLNLTLEPQEVINPDDGKKKRVYCLNLRTLDTMRHLMALTSQPVKSLLLPEPVDEEQPPDNYAEEVVEPQPEPAIVTQTVTEKPEETPKEVKKISPAKARQIAGYVVMDKFDVKKLVEDNGWGNIKNASELTEEQGEIIIKAYQEWKGKK